MFTSECTQYEVSKIVGELQNDRLNKMTVHINNVVAQVLYVVETYSFYYMKEKGLINTSQK